MNIPGSRAVAKVVKWAFYAVAALGVIAVLAVWEYRIEEKAAFAKNAAIEPAAIAVTVAEAQERPIINHLLAEGYAQATRKAFLQFEEAGRVVFVANDPAGGKLREGSKVAGPGNTDPGTIKKGQVLARIDTRDKYSEIRWSEAALEEARKNLSAEQANRTKAEVSMEEAKRDLDRKKRLLDQKFISPSNYEEAVNQYRMTVEEVRIAGERIAAARSRIAGEETRRLKALRGPEKMTLRAPFDGVVARINIREGDYFDPSDVMRGNKVQRLETAPITLLDPGRMEVLIHLPDFMGKQVRTGQSVVVTPAKETWSPGVSLETADRAAGTVYSVSPHIDAAKRAVRIKIRLTGNTRVVSDGMYVSCWIAVEEKPAALSIPLSGLLFRGSTPYVYREKDGSAYRRNLTLGIKDSAYVEVLEGLVPGDRVVCRGRRKLTPGASVRVVPGKQKNGEDDNVL